jgi:hypothetical protein
MNPYDIRLEYRDTPGTGKEIYAHFGKEFNCIQFTMRGDVGQPITYLPENPPYICSEPWIQFEPKEWSDSIELIFKEMVELWNEKYNQRIHKDAPKDAHL